MTINEKYSAEIMAEFQRAAGKGYCFCVNPITPYKLVAQTAINVCNKDTNRKVYIVTSFYDYTQKIKAEIAKIAPENNYNVTYNGSIYINPKFNYNYDCTIVVGINGEDNGDIEKLRKLINCSKFTLVIFTNSALSVEMNKFVQSNLKFLKTSITPDEARVAYLYSPVEEYRYSVPLSDLDKEEYDKADAFIRESITIFGSLQNIEQCARGNKVLNISASEFRYNFAKENSWNEHLDMTSDYERSIDDVYNPNALNERANTFYTISHKRKEIALRNENKYAKIAEIVKNNADKKIVIVSKHGETALTIANYLNQPEFQELGINCGQYHDCIPDAYDVDNEGNVIVQKSGKDKGKPKVIKSQALSSRYLALFNANSINILSIKFASNPKLKIAFDLIIFTDPNTANITHFKNRFVNAVCTESPNKVYRIYSKDTIEERDINNENILNNVQIMSSEIDSYIM